jgi:hypothetical protein
MNLNPICVLALALASCSPDAPAPAAAPMKPAAEAVPAPEKPAPPVPATPSPKPMVEKKEEVGTRIEVPVAIPLEPKKEDPAPGQIYLPAFTFRTMDNAAVEVQINGVRLSTTPCPWSISDTIDFDPKIPVPQWPPSGAKLVGTTKRLLDNKQGSAELYAAPGEKEGEQILYVDGKIGDRLLRGALRLYVGTPGKTYRLIDYAPVMDVETEGASRFQRTLWFESRD